MQGFDDVLFLLVIVGVISFIVYLVIKDNKKRQSIEENENVIVKENGDKKQICFWCKQEINVGARICPYCKKVPTKSGRDNRQIEIFIAIILILLSIFLWF